MSIDYNKNLTPQDMLDVICYNLAQFSFLYDKYKPGLAITDYEAFLNLMTSHIYQNAQERVEKLKKLHSLKNKNKLKEKTYLEMSARLNDVPYNVYKVAANKSYAKHIAKSFTLLGDFDVIVQDQKTTARFFDSVGKTGLLGPNNDIYQTHLGHYQEYHSIGPILNNTTPVSIANQESVEMLVSRIKPNKSVKHQIWINDHLMIQTNFSTPQSLSDYFNEHPDKIKDLLYVISYAEEIDKKAQGRPSQKFIDEEMKKARIEYAKNQAENSLEQYAILASELFAQLIKKLKKGLPNLSGTKKFDDLDQIPGKTRQFKQNEIDKMEIYQSVRDSMAHPTKYNLRPLGNHSQPFKNQNLLASFVPDMIEYLSILFNISKKDIANKINSHTQEEIFDVRALIALMDTRKAFRDICVKREKLPNSTQGIFKTLGLIDSAEETILKAALECRNKLCHGKIDWDLAKKAETLALEAKPIMDKIATGINKKYGTSIQEYFNTQYNPKSNSIQDLKAQYPFLNNAFETDPDRPLFENAFKQKQIQTKTILDRKLLLELYTFAMTLQKDLIVQKNVQKTSFEQSDVNPFINEIGAVIQAKQEDKPFKTFVAEGVINAWLKGYAIPQKTKS